MIDINETLFASYRRSLRAGNRSEQTIDSYRKALTELDAYLGRSVVTAKREDIEAYLEKRLGEISPTTVAIRFRSLRAFYAWAVAEEIITASPMTGLSEPKRDDAPVPVLSDDDLRTLIKACAGKTLADRRDEAIVRLLCEPGSPRLGELASLTVDALDMTRDQITVTGKTGTRVIPFGVKTGQALDRYLRLRAAHPKAGLDALWLAPKGRLSDSGIAQALAKRSAHAGLGRVHPHQLRHTSASAWLEAGGSEGDAVSLFGWSDATMIHKVYGRSAAASRATKAARRASMGDRL